MSNVEEEIQRQKLPRNFALLGKSAQMNMELKLTEVCMFKCDKKSDFRACIDKCTYKANSMSIFLDNEFKILNSSNPNPFLY